MNKYNIKRIYRIIIIIAVPLILFLFLQDFLSLLDDIYSDQKTFIKISIAANISTTVALVITIVLIIGQQFRRINEEDNREKALKKEIKVNFHIFLRVKKHVSHERVPGQRYHLLSIERAIETGELPNKIFDTYWNFYMSLKNSNRIIEELNSITHESNTSFAYPAKQAMCNNTLKRKYDNLREELELSEKLFNELGFIENKS